MKDMELKLHLHMNNPNKELAIKLIYCQHTINCILAEQKQGMWTNFQAHWQLMKRVYGPLNEYLNSIGMTEDEADFIRAYYIRFDATTMPEKLHELKLAFNIRIQDLPPIPPPVENDERFTE